MQVCPAGTSCTAAGVTATTFPCSPALAQDNSLPLITCNDDTVPAVAIQFTGDLPVVGTYDQTDTSVASATVICAGSLSGDYWAAGPADESALGTYSVTITSVVAGPGHAVDDGGPWTDPLQRPRFGDGSVCRRRIGGRVAPLLLAS